MGDDAATDDAAAEADVGKVVAVIRERLPSIAPTADTPIERAVPTSDCVSEDMFEGGEGKSGANVGVGPVLKMVVGLPLMRLPGKLGEHILCRR